MKIDIAMGGTPPYVSEIFIGEDVMERVPRRSRGGPWRPLRLLDMG